MAKAKRQELSIQEKLEQALVPEVKQPYEVPSNWVWTKLESIVTIKTGKKDANYGNENGKYLFFTCAAEPLRCEGYSFEGESILLAGNGANVGLALYYDGQFEAYQRTYVLQSKSKLLLLKYIYYHLNGFWKLYNSDKQYGSATNYIKLGNFQEYPIPIPPLAEQQRIVDRIERLFEKLDSAKDLAQNALDTFETRKAAILNKAFTGKLTAKWREKNGVGMDSWEEGILLKYIKEKPRNGYSPSPVNYATKVKSLSLSATTSGEFRSEFFKYIAENIAEDSHLWLKTDDILIQRANSIEKVGTSAIYTGRDGEFIYPDLMMKISVNALAIPRYLAYYLNTTAVREYYRSNATGTAGNMPKINQAIVANTPVVVPSILEQQEIVRTLDYLFENEQKANELCDVIDKIDLMKKAILARAFRGDLGTNEPSEENAIELLKTNA